MAQSKGSLKSFGVKRRGKNIGNHWSSIWLEWTDQHYWPFRASGVSQPRPWTRLLLGTQLWKRPFTDQPDDRGVRQTSTTLVGRESANYKLSKTIQGTMLHKTAHLRAWQESGPCADLTLWESSVRTREAMGPPSTPLGLTAKVKPQKELPFKHGERRSETMWKRKANRYSYVQNKNTYMYRSVTLWRSFFFYIQRNHELLLGTGWLC